MKKSIYLVAILFVSNILNAQTIETKSIEQRSLVANS
jgi:hypothetical protein